METKHALPYDGNGVELDWMRAFWVVHTRGSSDPTMNDLLRWIDAADDGTNPSWTDTNIYNLLDAEAARRGGTLNANWNFAAADHGIDHPDH
jgi:hypothetical protein